MAFKDEFDKTQEEMGSSDFFKFQKDGDYRFRIMGEPVKKVSRFGTGYGICYAGAVYCQKASIDADYEKAKAAAIAEGKDPEKVKRSNLSFKWLMWAINRTTGKLVILELTNTVVKKLRNYMDSDEYGFKAWPMPYDITVSVVNAGTKEAEYDMVAARKDSPITPEETEAFEKLTPIDQIVERMKAKKREVDGVPAPTEEEGATPEIQAGETPVASGEEGGVAYPTEDINPEDIPF